MEFSFDFWTQKFDLMMIFLSIFLDAYVSFFFFEFFKGPFLWVFFNAMGISPLVMLLLEILWWLYHLSIFLLSLFFSLVDFFVSGQHIDLPLFPLALGAKWKNLCIFFCFLSQNLDTSPEARTVGSKFSIFFEVFWLI